MRNFYLTKNSYGYYYVTFVNPQTGKKLTAKSTHTKDQVEAIKIAAEWEQSGITRAHAGSHSFDFSLAGESKGQFLNLKALAERLTQEQLTELYGIVSTMLNLPTPSTIPTPAEATTTNQTLLPKTESTSLIQNTVETLPAATPTPEVKTPKPNNSDIKPSSQLESLAKKKTVIVLGRGHKNKRVIQLPEDRFRKSGDTSKGSDSKLIEGLEKFWNFDNSQFVQEQLALGRRISRRNCIDNQGHVKNYWKPYWTEDATISMLDTNSLSDFFFYLRLDVGLSASTVNKAISCGNMYFKYLKRKGLIESNPFLGVERFSQNDKKRDIPTESEIARLLHHEWKNKAFYYGFNLGAFCGLREGEIAALRMNDLDLVADLIHVRHSWSIVDGLKSTKNTDCRDVPCDHKLLLQMAEYARCNPEYSDLSYVFWTPFKSGQPYLPEQFRKAFYEAMYAIGISEEQRQERNIVFHSLRHFCATLLKDRMKIESVKEILGHRTLRMTEHYSNHQTEESFKHLQQAMFAGRQYMLELGKVA